MDIRGILLLLMIGCGWRLREITNAHEYQTKQIGVADGV